MQTFPECYPVADPHGGAGTLLSTQAQWGWHNVPGAARHDLAHTRRVYDTPRGPVPYVDMRGSLSGGADSPASAAESWLRNNPHRLDLGRIGWSTTRGVSVVDYGASVLERFANPAIGHRALQVAVDGSQKLPQRVLYTVADRRAAGASPRWAALVVAAWMRFVAGRADDGRPLPLDDPLADELRAAVAAGGGAPGATVDALLGVDAVFSPDLAADDEVRALVTEWYTALSRHGVVTTLAGA